MLKYYSLLIWILNLIGWSVFYLQSYTQRPRKKIRKYWWEALCIPPQLFHIRAHTENYSICTLLEAWLRLMMAIGNWPWGFRCPKSWFHKPEGLLRSLRKFCPKLFPLPSLLEVSTARLNWQLAIHSLVNEHFWCLKFHC